MVGYPEQSQDGADHHDNNTERPVNGDLRDEPMMGKVTSRKITFSS
jgi:hypothetical protein